MSELDPVVDFDMVADDWVYHGEGNGSILFAYTGKDPQMQNQLLRLVKREVTPNSSTTDSTSSSDTLSEKDEQKSMAKLGEGLLYTNIIGSLLGDAYILPQRVIRVSVSFIHNLNAAAQPIRPAHRTHKEADPRQAFGVVIADMVGSGRLDNGLSKNNNKRDNFVSVEIKPKWGFLPKSSCISQETSVKRRVCRYCMHQHLKHGPEMASSFCPLDLYSGNLKRMGRALDCLASSPQNNLRVFVNGDIVGSTSDGSLDTDRVPQWTMLRQHVIGILQIDGILRKLAHLQSQLDHLDVEGIFPLYKRAVANGEMDKHQPTINEWLNACSRFKTRQSARMPNESVSGIDDRQAILEFMLSVTLKDISILIQIKPWPQNASTSLPICDSNNEDSRKLSGYRMVVIDTDAKKLAKLPEYFEKDQEIVKHYLENNPDSLEQKPCIE
ncbi:hypothetical protein H4R99_006172 [Coemansia sp. RSA 1722]|nr:hypothetical protein LPJ57_004107 [Coemansia sp. RSA 486]KAJ2230449.1 hypothetical protein IWW45_005798 [Coemansia sp. RSA 485]KAJ2593165.1 hypothetical protein H4R99_006172 [Coemansia sp. RSA 1722]KAJ2601915.1 hypothetical protein GGF39_001016 [Coemansia sp. RSA 1721]